MRHRTRAVNEHDDAIRRRAAEAFLDWKGLSATLERACAISQLPTVSWKGKRLYTLRCEADVGNGPHDVNVPESLLWALSDLTQFRCADHR